MRLFLISLFPLLFERSCCHVILNNFCQYRSGWRTSKLVDNYDGTRKVKRFKGANSGNQLKPKFFVSLAPEFILCPCSDFNLIFSLYCRVFLTGSIRGYQTSPLLSMPFLFPLVSTSKYPLATLNPLTQQSLSLWSFALELNLIGVIPIRTLRLRYLVSVGIDGT